MLARDVYTPLMLARDVQGAVRTVNMNLTVRLLVVRDQRLGERLPDGVDLGHVATALHTDADVNVSKPVLSKKQNWLHELELQSSRLHQLQRAAIHLDETLPPLAVGHGGGSLLAPEGLDTLYG